MFTALALLTVTLTADGFEPILRDDARFEGTWDLISSSDYPPGQRFDSMRLTAKRGVWRGIETTITMTRRAGKPYPRYHWREDWSNGLSSSMSWHDGLYQLEGDTLTMARPGRRGAVVRDLAPSKDVVVEVWKRVKAKP